MDQTEKTVYRLHADVCKTLSHPVRIEIIDRLRDGEVLAGELSRCMNVSKANLSQHLSVLRNQGIIGARRSGVHIYYRISNPKVVQACQLMREVLLERLSVSSELLQLVKEGGE